MTDRFPCPVCEGTGDHWRPLAARPASRRSRLRTRRYGVPCPSCDGTGHVLCEDCGEVAATECWDDKPSMFPNMKPEYYCEHCADHRRDSHAEHMAENF